jgi:hypothetical protein
MIARPIAMLCLLASALPAAADGISVAPEPEAYQTMTTTSGTILIGRLVVAPPPRTQLRSKEPVAVWTCIAPTCAAWPAPGASAGATSLLPRVQPVALGN